MFRHVKTPGIPKRKSFRFVNLHLYHHQLRECRAGQGSLEESLVKVTSGTVLMMWNKSLEAP